MEIALPARFCRRYFLGKEVTTGDATAPAGYLIVGHGNKKEFQLLLIEILGLKTGPHMNATMFALVLVPT